jgi:transposase-like protein
MPDDDSRAQYTPAELQDIRQKFVAGEMPTCPRCGVAMTRREIGGGSFGLGYARQRDWLICSKCRRSAIFDVHRGTRT